MKTFLIILIFFIATTSMLSGLLMISSPNGELMNLPLSLLDRTPFKDFFVPGILVTFLLGIVYVTTAVRIARQSKGPYHCAVSDGLIAVVYLIAQMILIHAFHWVHVFFVGISLLVILIAYLMKGKWAM